MKSLREKLTQTFLFPYFIHAGLSDAITTVFALNMGFSELNPFISVLFPVHVYLIPAALVAFAYFRALSAVWLFKKKRDAKIMLWITLYFPAAFNIIVIMWFFLNQR